MKGERKLRLVPPADVDGFDRPATEAEQRAAASLREAIDRGVDPLSAALAAAFRPASIDDDDSDALLARALGDADAAPTKAERAMADRLAAELSAQGGDRSAPQSEEGELSVALRAAWAPRPIDPQKNEAMIAQAMRRAEPARPKPRRALVFTMVSLASAAAMAAGIALIIGRMIQVGGVPARGAAEAPGSSIAAAQASFIRARSASELFDAATPFPRSGGESARIDRIASARAADLRANRFAAWGVQ